MTWRSDIGWSRNREWSSDFFSVWSLTIKTLAVTIRNYVSFGFWFLFFEIYALLLNINHFLEWMNEWKLGVKGNLNLWHLNWEYYIMLIINCSLEMISYKKKNISVVHIQRFLTGFRRQSIIWYKNMNYK